MGELPIVVIANSEIRLSFSFLLTFPYHSVPLNDVIGTLINEILSKYLRNENKKIQEKVYIFLDRSQIR